METNELYLSIEFDCKSDKVGVVVGFRVSELPGCVDIRGSLLVEGCAWLLKNTLVLLKRTSGVFPWQDYRLGSSSYEQEVVLGPIQTIDILAEAFGVELSTSKYIPDDEYSCSITSRQVFASWWYRHR